MSPPEPSSDDAVVHEVPDDGEGVIGIMEFAGDGENRAGGLWFGTCPIGSKSPTGEDTTDGL